MPLPKTWDEIKANPVFLTGFIIGLLGIGVALYGKFGAKSNKNLYFYGGVAAAISAFVVGFGSTFIPPPDATPPAGTAGGTAPLGFMPDVTTPR